MVSNIVTGLSRSIPEATNGCLGQSPDPQGSLNALSEIRRHRQSFLEAFGFEMAPGVATSVGDVPVAIYQFGGKV